MKHSNIDNISEHSFYKIHKQVHSFVLGIAVIIAGILLLLSNLEIIEKQFIHYLFSWQSLIIFIGILVLIAGFKKNWLSGVILITVGTLFLIDDIYGLQYNTFNLLWPILLIIIGISVLIKVFITHRINEHTKNVDTDFAKNHFDDYINATRIFSGINMMINSQNFKGGNVSFIFGGGELDFRTASLADGVNILKIECVFGGVKIIVPDNWNISLETSGVFGGFSDERRHLNIQAKETGKKLIIKGEAIFGGGEITNA